MSEVGYALMQQNALGPALEVLRWNASRHPGSVKVYDALADGYVQLVAYRRLLAVAPGDSTSSEEDRRQFQKLAEKKPPSPAGRGTG